MPIQLVSLRKRAIAAVVMAALSFPCLGRTLSTEGQVFEIIEEDFRITMLKLIAQKDWSEEAAALEDSARNYTKNLPGYFLPRAEKTITRWKDVGVVVSEDIYIPWVDWETGSVTRPEKRLLAAAGSYYNPIIDLPAAGIERLFIFDATDPDQLTMAKALMAKDIPLLNFMLIAGDPGALSEEMQQPVYHPSPGMLEKFNVRVVPALIGFGVGAHAGHMAITDIKLPSELSVVKDAWFGLNSGESPEQPAKTEGAQ